MDFPKTTNPVNGDDLGIPHLETSRCPPAASSLGAFALCPSAPREDRREENLGKSSITTTGWWLTYPSEKYELVSWDDEIPNIWKVITAMFQTTNQSYVLVKHG